MSSKGTHIYAVRLPEEMMEAVQLQVLSRNNHTREAPWTLSDFIRVSIRDKLAKMARCRKSRRPRRTGAEKTGETLPTP